jgi:hypothetical protein
MRLSWIVLSVVCVGCGGADNGTSASGDDDDATDDGSATSLPETEPPACDSPMTSLCGNQSSIVQGHVRLAEGIEPVTGTLFLALNHEIYEGSLGGGYHMHTLIPNADLSEPVPFAIDMCADGEMWTEENGPYTLIAILDKNGNQSPGDMLPEGGEPSTRIADLDLSCSADALCLDVVLDCIDGADCVSFADETCDPNDEGHCGSDFSLCTF